MEAVIIACSILLGSCIIALALAFLAFRLDKASELLDMSLSVRFAMERYRLSIDLDGTDYEMPDWLEVDEDEDEKPKQSVVSLIRKPEDS